MLELFTNLFRVMDVVAMTFKVPDINVLFVMIMIFVKNVNQILPMTILF